MTYLIRFINEFRFNLMEYFRNPLEAFFGTLFLAAIPFTLIYVSDNNSILSIPTSSFTIGYLAWMLATASFLSISKCVVDEVTKGTVLSHVSDDNTLLSLVINRGGSSIVISIILNIFVVLAPVYLYNPELLEPALKASPYLVAGIPSALGIGLILGAVSLISKKTDSILMIGNLLFISLVFMPYTYITAALPFVHALKLSKLASTGRTISLIDIALVFIISSVYLVIGCLVFFKVENKCRDKGTLNYA